MRPSVAVAFRRGLDREDGEDAWKRVCCRGGGDREEVELERDRGRMAREREDRLGLGRREEDDEEVRDEG